MSSETVMIGAGASYILRRDRLRRGVLCAG